MGVGALSSECNTSLVLELELAYKISNYKKYTNSSLFLKIIGSNSLHVGKSYSQQKLNSFGKNVIKFNTNTTKNSVNKTTATKYIYRDRIESISKKDRRSIRDISILVNETLVFQNVLKQIIQENYSKVIIESNSIVAI